MDLWLSLFCAFLFAAAALAVKRGNELGISPWTSTHVSNLATVVGFLCLWPLGGTFPGWLFLWQPAIVALTFVVGQGLAFLAFARGDVSLAMPVLGIKILLVAVLVAVLIGQPLGPTIWIAALLSTVAVAMLNRTDHLKTARAGRTVTLAGGAALMFATFDVLVQKWGPAWGTGRFLPILMLFVAAISLTVDPFMRRRGQRATRAAWTWLLAGSTLMAIQSAIFVTVILVYQNAAPANVILSSRGIWSVVLVWAVGHWFQSAEQGHGARILAWRLAGAVLMFVAIGLVVLA